MLPALSRPPSNQSVLTAPIARPASSISSTSAMRGRLVRHGDVAAGKAAAARPGRNPAAPRARRRSSRRSRQDRAVAASSRGSAASGNGRSGGRSRRRGAKRWMRKCDTAGAVEAKGARLMGLDRFPLPTPSKKFEAAADGQPGLDRWPELAVKRPSGRTRPPVPKFPDEQRPEFGDPALDRLIRDVEAALGQEVRNVVEAEVNRRYSQTACRMTSGGKPMTAKQGTHHPFLTPRLHPGTSIRQCPPAYYPRPAGELFRLLAAPNAGRNSHHFPECRREVAMIGKAAFERDLREACLAVE